MGTTEPRVAVHGRDKDGHLVFLGEVPTSTYRRDSRILLGLAPKEESKPQKTEKPTTRKSKAKPKSRRKSKKK